MSDTIDALTEAVRGRVILRRPMDNGLGKDRRHG
jgi:hypothetical protein